MSATTFAAKACRSTRKSSTLFSNEIIAEMTGYGPLEPLLKDPTVTDILINTHRRCFIERFGQLQETKVHFKDEAHLLRIINRIVSAIGRRVDESSPMVDARLRDGSRVNVAVQADRRRWAAGFDPKIRRARLRHGPARRSGKLAAGDRGGSCGGGRGQGFDAHRRGHRVRQDDDAQRAVEFHSRLASA